MQPLSKFIKSMNIQFQRVEFESLPIHKSVAIMWQSKKIIDNLCRTIKRNLLYPVNLGLNLKLLFQYDVLGNKQ